MNKITTLGIDLAKSVFQLHGIDLAGKVVLRREVRRARLMKTIAQLEPCLIGIEACGYRADIETILEGLKKLNRSRAAT